MTRKRPAQRTQDQLATQAYNTEKDTDVQIYKHLFKTDSLVHSLNNCYTDMYMYHVKHTLPWMDRGVRMIDNSQYINYMTEVGKYRDTLDSILKAIEPKYDDMVKEDLARLKSLGNAADYPDYNSFANAWKVDVSFRPVPQSGDFRVQVAQEVADGLEQSLQDLGVETTKYLRQELVEALEAAVLAVNKDDKERRLFASMLTNLEDLANRVNKLNVLNNSTLTTACDKVLTTVIPNYSIEELRKFAPARVAFASDLQLLLTSLENM
jgi:hypothetical protein